MGPRAGLDTVEKIKISCLEWKPGHPAPNLLLYRLICPDSSKRQNLKVKIKRRKQDSVIRR
jgi:hypothetical protein